jgi:hypothetical protein
VVLKQGMLCIFKSKRCTPRVRTLCPGGWVNCGEFSVVVLFRFPNAGNSRHCFRALRFSNTVSKSVCCKFRSVVAWVATVRKTA